MNGSIFPPTPWWQDLRASRRLERREGASQSGKGAAVSAPASQVRGLRPSYAHRPKRAARQMLPPPATPRMSRPVNDALRLPMEPTPHALRRQPESVSPVWHCHSAREDPQASGKHATKAATRTTHHSTQEPSLLRQADRWTNLRQVYSLSP